MNVLINAIMAFLRSKVAPLWTKLRKCMNSAWLRSVLLAKLRGMLEELFDIKPKSREDYYYVSSWMISRKLAVLATVILGFASLFVILLFHPFDTSAGMGTVKTYWYNSIPLKFQNGVVRIRAKDGYIAYVGEVAKGCAAGEGRLYGKEGNLIYEGSFADNQYDGMGKLYGGNGMLQYDGQFKANVYQGTGTEYWDHGTRKYTGNFENGLKSGEGELCNGSGDVIFRGLFQSGEPVFAQLVNKTTEEAGELYMGETQTYNSDTEFCVDLEEIGAVYMAADGSDSLDPNWKVERVYVLRNQFFLAGETYTTIAKLKQGMGNPSYEGYSNMVLAEAVGIARLREQGDFSFPDPGISANREFEEVTRVEGYNQSFDLYLYAFEYDGLVYSFYCEKPSDKFVMYSIERAR